MDRTQVQTPRTVLVIANSDVRDPGSGPKHVTLDPQLRSMLQWLAASIADIPQIQLSPDRELQQVIVAIFLTNRFPLWSSLVSTKTLFKPRHVASVKEVILSVIVCFEGQQSCKVLCWFPPYCALLWRQTAEKHQLL